LRFPGFEGEWEECINERLFSISKEKNKSRQYSTVLSASQTEGMVERNSLGIDIKFDAESVSGYKVVKPGEYVIHLRSFQGGFAFSNKTGICSPAYTILHPHEAISYGFFRDYFMSPKFIDSLKIVTYGIRDGKSISVEEWMKLKTSIPKSHEEQEKISSFLNLIDERISIQNKVIKDLISLEKEIVLHVFKTLKTAFQPLSMISERVATRNDDSLCNNVLTISAREGLISQLDFFNKSVASQNLSNYILLKKGDFAYNKSYSTDHPWGAIKHLELYEEGVLSPLYICFRPIKSSVNTDYLQLYFETDLWHKHVSDISVEGARNHGLLNMAVGDFMSMPVPVPEIEIQNGIAHSLKCFRIKKINEMKYREFLLQQKTYLLSHLFI